MRTTNKLLKCLAVLSVMALLPSFVNPVKPKFFKKLNAYCEVLPKEFDQISEERKKSLTEIGDYIIAKKAAGKHPEILFICTSNSRGSHLGQVWAQTATLYYGVDSLWTFSGGTEATAVNINAINALERCGFTANSNKKGDNPKWYISPGEGVAFWHLFSKKYDDAANPKKDFCAVMVCAAADKSCPVVEGSDLRVSLPYEDPKAFDGTPSQDQKYDERCRQIAREMFFVMEHLSHKSVVKK